MTQSSGAAFRDRCALHDVAEEASTPPMTAAEEPKIAALVKKAVS